MNSQLVSFAAKIKEGKILALLLAAALAVSGFFIANMALAAHTATVSVDKTLVKGGTTQTYSFSVANGSGSAAKIFQIKITPPAGFIITGSLVCPSSWGADTTGNVATCLIDPFVEGTLVAGAQTTVSFSATSPSNDSSAPWNVQTKDNSGDEISITSAVTTVDATAPTIQSVVTLDADGNGSIDQAQVNFSENVVDATFAAGAFAISGTAASSLATGTANDSQITLNFSTQITGTGVKTLNYTANTGADTVGNLLATASPAATDQAAPVFLSARTIATNQIEATFSEDLLGTTVTNADFSVDGQTLTGTASESNGVVILTTAGNFGTGETPAITYNINVSNGVKDLNNNTAPAVSSITPVDDVAPVISSTRTLSTTTIQVTFSEPMSAVAASDFTVNNGSNAITGVTFSGPSTTAILNLGTIIGTGDTPVVRTVASPAGTFDNAGTPNTITGNLSSAPDDGIAPTVALTSGAGSYTNASQSPISVTATFSETVTGFANADIAVTNGTAGNFAGSGAVYTFDVTPSNEGALTITVPASSAQDAAATPNNNTVSNTISTIYDSIVPAAPVITSIAADDKINNSEKAAIVVVGTAEAGATVNVTLSGTITVTGSVTANGSGAYSVTIDGTALADGAVSGSATATDVAANTSLTSTAVVATKDVSVPAAPVITSIATDGKINNSEKAAIVVVGTAEAGSTVNVSLADGSTTVPGSGIADGSGNYSITINGTALADGTITPSVTATDAAGNVSTAATTPTAAKDVVAPNAAIVGTISGIPVDSRTNQSPINISINFNEPVYGFIDDDITIGNGYISSNGGNFNDSSDGLSTYTFSVQPDGWPGSFVKTITLDIAAGVTQDAAGNTSAVATQFSVIYDNLAPTVTLSAQEGVSVSDLIVRDADTVDITATFDEDMSASPAPTISISNAGITGATMTATEDPAVWTYSWDVPTGDLAAVATVAGKDLANNTYAGSTNLSFTVDNTAPTAAQATAVDALTNDTTPAIAVNVESGASWVITDGTANYGSGTGTGASQAATLSALTEGAHTLDLVATDTAGNITTTPLTPFTIDLTNPTVAISSPAADSVTVGADITLASTASDDASGVACQYQVDSGSLTTIACAGGSITGLSDGRHTISLIATDGAGNTATTNVSIVINTDGTLSVASSGADFTSIQTAVSQATAGDTLSIASGTYAENVTIDKNLILTGTDSPTATSFTLASGAVVSASTGITAPTVNVASGAKIQDGILLAGSGGTVNVASGAYDEQLQINKDITLSGATGATLQPTGNDDAWDVQFVAGATGATLQGFTLDFNGSGTRPGRGIVVSDLDGPAVTGVTIQNNDITMGVGTGAATVGLEGVGIQTGKNADVSGLLVDSNQFHGGSAVITDGSTAGEEGIYVNPNSGSGTVTISNNTFDGQLFAGISVEADNVTVSGNTVNRPAPAANTHGIRLNDFVTGVTYNVTISNNAVSGFETGVRLGQTSEGGSTYNVSVTGNTITNNTRGIWARQDSVVTASGNTISGNTTIGAEIHGDGQLNAVNNWWGDASGPTVASNPTGAGDAVSSGVTFRPWYLSADFTGLDQTVPTASTFVPSNLSVGISPTADVNATFSEAVNILASDITFSPTVANVAVTFAASTNTATITHDALADNTTYTVTLGAGVADLSGNQLTSTSWSFTTSGSYSITLTKGWNLISFPVDPVDTGIAAVLGGASTDIDAVWSYDPSAGQWLVYRPNTNTGLNNLFNVTSGYGYWVDYTSAAPTTLSGPGNLFLEGNNTPPQRTLQAGWNLIGYFQKQNTTSVAATYALKTLYNPETGLSWWSQLFGYNNSTKQFTSVVDPSVAGTSDLDPGKGYWVLLSGKATDTYIYAPGLTPTP